MAVYNPFDFFLEPHAEHVPVRLRGLAAAGARSRSCAPSRRRRASPPTSAAVAAGRRRTIDFLVDLNRQLQRDIRYVIRLEPGVQSKEETLELRPRLLPRLGLAARAAPAPPRPRRALRLRLPDPARPRREGARRPGGRRARTSPTCTPGARSTCRARAGSASIRRRACSPARDTFRSPARPSRRARRRSPARVDECEVGVRARDVGAAHLRVAARHPARTPTRSGSAIVALGRRGRRATSPQMDVRLTMGGEPTFVVRRRSRRAPSGTPTALGPTKRALRGRAALAAASSTTAPDGFVHFGQGKWYPGEQLPRWALGCYWRRDGEPAWNDVALVRRREPSTTGTRRRRRGALPPRPGGPPRRQRRARPGRLRGRLVLPAGASAGCRSTSIPSTRGSTTRSSASGCAACSRSGLDAVGRATPCRSRPATTARRCAWRTGPWFLRGERMYLIPGDSPMGFRLPARFAAVGEPPTTVTPTTADRETRRPRARPLPAPTTRRSRAARPGGSRRAAGPAVERAARSERAQPRRAARAARRASSRRLDRAHRPLRRAARRRPLRVHAAGRDARGLPRPRGGGRGHGRAARHAGPARGLPAPRRSAAGALPDHPGSRRHRGEHPARGELGRARRADDDPLRGGAPDRASRPRSSCSTAATPARAAATTSCSAAPTAGRQPVPAAARSAAQPARRTGTTTRRCRTSSPASSSARRARRRAWTRRATTASTSSRSPSRQLPARAPTTPPWLVDRLFRHLLVDVTGNTHRAEFCIDKMYSPDTAAGRRGLLELRAFEMPPHARMSLAQQLLLRALVARFWREPYARAARALGHRAARPLHAAVLRRGSTSRTCSRSCAAPATPSTPSGSRRTSSSASRCYGEVASARHPPRRCARRSSRGTSWARRARGGGTVRYVDSSVERLQVLVTGLTGDRYVVTCNGRALPLQPTGRNGESVAGVRYRAWQPPSCLHPTIPVHAPLTFDIVDTWMERSLGRLPVPRDASGRPELRAASRSTATRPRAAAWRASSTLGHTPGRLAVPRAGAEPRVPLHPGPAHADLPARCPRRIARAAGGRRGRRRASRAATGVPRARRPLRRAPRRPGRALRAHWQSFAASAGVAERGRPRADAGAGRAADPRERRHLQRLRGRRRPRAPVGPRRAAPDHARRRVGAAGRRAAPARAAR